MIPKEEYSTITECFVRDVTVLLQEAGYELDNIVPYPIQRRHWHKDEHNVTLHEWKDQEGEIVLTVEIDGHNITMSSPIGDFHEYDMTDVGYMNYLHRMKNVCEVLNKLVDNS
jgi:hypothetical protein